jgi:hypothetical protein
MATPTTINIPPRLVVERTGRQEKLSLVVIEEQPGIRPAVPRTDSGLYFSNCHLAAQVRRATF